MNVQMTNTQIRSIAQMIDVSEEIVETVAYDQRATIEDVENVYIAVVAAHDTREIMKRTLERHPEVKELHYRTFYGRVA